MPPRGKSAHATANFDPFVLGARSWHHQLRTGRVSRFVRSVGRRDWILIDRVRKAGGPKPGLCWSECRGTPARLTRHNNVSPGVVIVLCLSKATMAAFEVELSFAPCVAPVIAIGRIDRL